MIMYLRERSSNGTLGSKNYPDVHVPLRFDIVYGSLLPSAKDHVLLDNKQGNLEFR